MFIQDVDSSDGSRQYFKVDWKKFTKNFFILEKETWLSKALAEYPDMEISSALVARCKITYYPNNLSRIEKIWYKYVKNCPDFPFNFNKNMSKLFFEDQKLIVKSTDLSKTATLTQRAQKRVHTGATKSSDKASRPSLTQHSSGKALKIRRIKTLYSETLIVDNFNSKIDTKTKASNLSLMEKLLDLPMVAKLTQNRLSVELSHLYPKKVMGLPLSMTEYLKLRNENLITSDSEYNFNYKEKDSDNLPSQDSIPAVLLNSEPTLKKAAASFDGWAYAGPAAEGEGIDKSELKKEFRLDVTTHYKLYLNNTN